MLMQKDLTSTAKLGFLLNGPIRTLSQAALVIPAGTVPPNPYRSHGRLIWYRTAFPSEFES